jgi:TATA-box binding protein (TBP) (component of TFIID and TFIIIB)
MSNTENSNDTEDNDGEYEEMDLKILNFIKMTNNKDIEVIPKPEYFTISTQSAMCCIEHAEELDLSKIVVFITKNIITNVILLNNPDYLIRGIVVDNLILRFDESYLKKYKKPYIKYLNNEVDPDNKEDCLLMLNSLGFLENNSLKKQGRQKKGTEAKNIENFYNSCSIIVKGALDIKCVNIKLFNNGKITLTGSKHEMDGYHAVNVLLSEMKKVRDIFINISDNNFNELKVKNYQITMINSDFDTNFKIDLIKLLIVLNTNEKELFTKFNPEKYRGLIVGFFWNNEKSKQDGKCNCTLKCNGKGTGTGNGQCKKITISIFKSGSVIITGGRLVVQIEDAYAVINEIFKKYYNEIIKLSILDFIGPELNEKPVKSAKKTIKLNIKKVCKIHK